MHRIAVLAYDSVVAVELAMVVQVFASANLQAGQDLYEVGVAGSRTSVATSALAGLAFSLVPDRTADWAASADTVVIPAHGSFLDPPPAFVGAALLAAHGRGARVASLCVGAFLLASTGLLDGRPATTHWHWADALADRFPAVHVQREKLFVGQDRVYTAAGVTAALDLALHLLELDHGAALAAATARFLVAPMRREGGQAQFIAYETPRSPSSLHSTLRWAEEHLSEDLTMVDLARHAHLTPRTFSRHFRAVVGATPLEWLLQVRVRRAKELLESTPWPIEQVATEAGFRSTATFRLHFGRLAGVTPTTYRRAFGSRVE